ncbi:MAG: 50S ribosomal protein L2 [bacterium]
MGIIQYKPTSPARRGMSVQDFSELTDKRPEKSLTRSNRRINGRNNQGRITVRYRGGAHKKLYRIIDFKRNKYNIPARVAAIEYDPNRTSWIALLNYHDGEKRYIISPGGLKVGDEVSSGKGSEVKLGNCLPLREIPLGTIIHNLEIKIGKGGQLGRSAGCAINLVAKEGDYAQVKMPSGEIRFIHLDCYAVIGQVSNMDHMNVSIGKAGRSRWLGKRPHVRGVVMNPIDHPLGGGEGKTSGGRHPCSPWGQPAKGYKTRRNKRTTNMIIRGKSKKERN